VPNTTVGALWAVTRFVDTCGTSHALLHRTSLPPRPGADPRAKSKEDETPLHRASRLGRVEAVICLIDACGLDALSSLSLSLPPPPTLSPSLGADPRAKSKEDETPLHRASRLGRLEAVACLIDACGLDALPL
jgi:ankyrin repeat protein